MFLFKKYFFLNNQKFGLVTLTVSSAALLTLATPATANSLSFDRKLIAPDGDSFDLFGDSVALYENYALIGSDQDDDNGLDSGSAYLFDTTTGNLLHKFIAPNGTSGDHFGISVALDGNYALIGSREDNDGLWTWRGSAYLFDTTTGNLLQKLIAPDGVIGDQFSISVALDGDYALIGSDKDDDNGLNSGSAYLFDTTTGNLLYKFIAPDGASGDWFGWSVALDENYALIGSRADDDNGSWSGSAYLFDTTTGNLLQKLIAPDGASGDQFGWSIALNEDYALISSFQDNDNGSSNGSAYLFDTTTGNLLHKFIAPDGDSGNQYGLSQFGLSVALDGNYALIGSSADDDNGSWNGLGYIFDTTTGNLLQKLIAPDGANDYHYYSGTSVALDGDYALIGSLFGEGKESYSGSAYLVAVKPAEKVSEPSVVVGLVAIGTLAAFKRKRQQKK